MATKKPTPAQLAARKLFAQRAKAGAFKRKTKRVAKKTAPAKRTKKQDLAIAMSEQRAGHPRKAKEFFERAARAKNPLGHTKISAPKEFHVHRANDHGEPGAKIGAFPKKTDAVQYANAYVKAHGIPVVILGKGL